MRLDELINVYHGNMKIYVDGYSRFMTTEDYELLLSEDLFYRDIKNCTCLFNGYNPYLKIILY